MTTNTEALPEPVNESLATDIDCIQVRYMGDPSYEHDGYYIRKVARKFIRDGYAIYTADQMHAHAAKLCAARDAEIERLKTLLSTSKPDCAECTQWVKQCADNKDWTSAVAEGKRSIRAFLKESKS
jgi:hypothetical protein